MIGAEKGIKTQSVDVEIERGWRGEGVTFRVCQVKTQGQDFETEETTYAVLIYARLSQVQWIE